jgi:hypothetical protein
MLTKMKCLLTCLTMCGSAAVCAGQATAPAKAMDTRSLTETMRFLQTALNRVPATAWVTSYHDNADGKNWSYKFGFEMKHVVADATACTVNYHSVITQDGVTTADKDSTIKLRDVVKLEVVTGLERQQQQILASGNATWHATVSPDVYDLVVRGPGSMETYILFGDEITAERVAQSMLHAAALCGGAVKAQ